MFQSKTEPVFKKALKDPLIHFMILGGLLFAAVSLWGGGAKSQNQILITNARQQHLADLFALTWQREPTSNELKNLIEEHIKEEIYYREALALGLDDNDTIVRRRLRQKLEFMQEDLSSLEPPTKAQLKAYFEANTDQYKTNHILSFKQILLSPKRISPGSPESMQALQMLNSGANPHTMSRSALLPTAMNLETTKSIINTFGADFMQALSGLETGAWSGPIYSGFGTHLVNVGLNQKPKPLTFVQVNNKVAVDYIQAKREQAVANYYKNLRSQYRITIEDAE